MGNVDWISVYAGNVNLWTNVYLGTLFVDERLCWDVNSWTSVYNTGMMNDNLMGHDIW